MGHGINIDSILALEEEIAAKEEEIIKLKRLRNSLLHVAYIPPEILGYIFRMCLAFDLPSDEDPLFGTVRTDSYNFLFVCHGWYEVACRTPELWSCWGNSLMDWKRRCLHFGTSPLDLVLDEMAHPGGSFDETLRLALRNRAERGLVREVHLKSRDADLVTSILSSLTPEDENARLGNVESISLRGVDLFNFFTRHRLPRLRELALVNCSGLALDHLTSYTTALVNLSLVNDVYSSEFIPTTSQLLSLLASNPRIEVVQLTFHVVEDDIGRACLFQVPLPHLKRFALSMDFPHVLTITQRLELPDKPDQVNLWFCSCTTEAVRQLVGPHIRDRVGGDPRFKSNLEISAFSLGDRIFFEASVADVEDLCLSQPPVRGRTGSKFAISLPQNTSQVEGDKLCTDIFALLPQERIVYLQTNLSAGLMEELLIEAPNIEVLNLNYVTMFEWFLLPNPDGPNAYKKLLPSLRWLCLRGTIVEDDDWDPLVRYLTHQTSDDHSISLSVSGAGTHICSDVLEEIRSLVDVFLYSPDPDKGCPFDCCSDYSD